MSDYTRPPAATPLTDPQADDERRKRHRRLAELGKRKRVKVRGNDRDGFTIERADDGRVLARCPTLDEVEWSLAHEVQRYHDIAVGEFVHLASAERLPFLLRAVTRAIVEHEEFTGEPLADPAPFPDG
jgi:hypothetical protein